MDVKLTRLLQRLAAGDAPRCSRRDFERLHAYLPGKLQLESRNGADTSGGFILTALRSQAETSNAIQDLLSSLANTLGAPKSVQRANQQLTDSLRTADLRLSGSELELLEVEMRNAIECGAQDDGFQSVHTKVLEALQKLREQR